MTEVNPTLSPIYLLRMYAWAVLKRNEPGTWDESKYGNLIPIVPLAEEPEIDEYDGPHIVYGYALSQLNSLPARKTGSMTFALYDQNFRRLTRTMTILQTAFERMDESATDVNKFTSNYTTGANNRPFEGLSFGYISLGFTEGGTPEETEGARQSALLNIKFEYYVDYNVITDVSL